MRSVWVTDVDLDLALHELATGSGRPLLILHALGAAAPDDVPDYAASWPGPVWALDFAGHGRSPVPPGGGYTAEAMVSEADAALAHVGEATVVGHGLGGYVALLLAGARPGSVRGIVIADGAGLAGGGPVPQPPYVESLPMPRTTPDPMAIAELSRDARPPDYAVSFASVALEESTVRPAIVVSARERPPWLAAVVAMHDVRELATAEAVAELAATP